MERLEKLISKTECKWVLTNLTPVNSASFKGVIKHDIIDWCGVKVGIMGIVEESWTRYLGKVDASTLSCPDFMESGRETAQKLKQDGAEIVVALTHMHYVNDEKLASIDDIDIILGGHDHDYDCRLVNNKHIIKSGSDFQDLTAISITIENGAKTFRVERHNVKQEEPDPEMTQLVKKLSHEIELKMQKEVFVAGVDLDTRYEHIRVEESAIGNMIADIMRKTFHAELCLLNAGSIRSNCLFKAGTHTMKDVIAMFPFDDIGLTIEVTGEEFVKELELSLRKYPTPNGRFPVVSGCTITFDPTLEPYQRIVSVLVNGSPIDLQRTYKLATNQYTAATSMRKELETDEGNQLSTVIAEHFHNEKVNHVLVTVTPTVEGRIITLNT